MQLDESADNVNANAIVAAVTPFLGTKVNQKNQKMFKLFSIVDGPSHVRMSRRSIKHA